MRKTPADLLDDAWLALDRGELPRARLLARRAAADPELRLEIRHLLADIKPSAENIDKVELLADATLNDLHGRAMSAETKEIFVAVREYLAAAAKELAEREHANLRNEKAFHEAAVEDEDYAARKAEFPGSPDGTWYRQPH